MAKLGILGGGAWGTALTTAGAKAGADVLLWAREDDVVQGINERHENPVFLPNIQLEPSVRATSDASELFDADAMLVVVPSQFLGVTLKGVAEQGLPSSTPLVLCSKGVEQSRLLLMGEVVEEVVDNPVLVLSGPTFAHEVARGLPTSAVLASDDEAIARDVVAPLLKSEVFKLFFSDDVIGAEIGGSIKNVIAIACGVSSGLGWEQNARAALMTRGLAEMRTLCKAKGGKTKTLLELCAVGDLILTCSSQDSRNMSLGYALGQGKALDEVLGDRVSVAEGVASAESVTQLAAKLGVELPVCQTVHELLEGTLSITAAAKRLLEIT